MYNKHWHTHHLITKEEIVDILIADQATNPDRELDLELLGHYLFSLEENSGKPPNIVLLCQKCGNKFKKLTNRPELENICKFPETQKTFIMKK
jgi:5-methylcytosine-specific restriction endonuclease McrA